MNRFHPLFVATALFLSCSSLNAHEDTILKLTDGKITGLPKKYLPASFDRNEKVLSIAGKRLAFPKVLHSLFADDYDGELFGEPVTEKGHPYDLEFSASWYHDSSTLPPYILIRIVPKDRDYAYELLIDLDKLTFLKANASIATAGVIPIDLDGKIDALKPDDRKGDSVDRNAPEIISTEDEEIELWHDGRITPQQPFKAQVVGVAPGWGGETVILKETGNEGRYCIANLANLALGTSVYEIVEASKFDQKEMLERGAVFLSPPVDAERFSWSMGIWNLGKEFGKDDFVAEWYAKTRLRKKTTRERNTGDQPTPTQDSQ